MTDLIVALDLDAPAAGAVFLRLRRELNQRWFKIGPRSLLDHSGMILIENMLREDARLFFDLKVYDTRDTVAATTRAAFAAGAEMLTVHATPSMLAAAMGAKRPGSAAKVLAVGALTDSLQDVLSTGITDETLRQCDGLVCSVPLLRWLTDNDLRQQAIFVCPGIRRGPPPDRPNSIEGGYESPDSHVRLGTPAEARAAGADFVVVGRPILNAADPVAAAWAILEELA
jgi:orotidine-5'-phosphate decarboxylase